jgi:hypothetical protein
MHLGHCGLTSRKRNQSQVAMFSGNELLPLEIQQPALHHTLNRLPCTESLHKQHVNATTSEDLGGQVNVLLALVYAAACNDYLKTLPSGRWHVKLDILRVATLNASAAVLPLMQGVDSLKLLTFATGMSVMAAPF